MNKQKAHTIKAGIHYYMENGYMVFTEEYHLLRGYCCSNGCRHCPFRKKEKDNGSNTKRDSA